MLLCHSSRHGALAEVTAGSPQHVLSFLAAGAYFGTTFAHLFQLTYPQLRPAKPSGACRQGCRQGGLVTAVEGRAQAAGRCRPEATCVEGRAQVAGRCRPEATSRSLAAGSPLGSH